jgi:serine acetyltransferase
VTINTGAILLPHKKVLDGGTIGAGSVAIRNVKNDTTVFGLPAVEI